MNNSIYFFDDYGSIGDGDFSQLLPLDRAEKYMRLRQRRDRENCLAAYLLLQYALRKNGIESFELREGKNGKPELADGRGIYFNISHCDCGAAVAVSDSAVGVDVQEMTEARQGVMRRVFSQGERELVSGAQDSAVEFTRLWTLKECTVKCEALTVAEMGRFQFETRENSFEKYGKKFKVFVRKNSVLSVCGDGDFSKIKVVNFTEVLP